jgi:Na+/melibiose symporter-like transporter
MLPDVIEMDERRTGKRREALFYSFFFLIEKMAIAFTQAGSSYTLALTGYISPTEQAAENETLAQPDSVLLALRILLCVIPALLKIVVVPFALSFPYICKRYGFTERGQEIEVVKESSPILHTKPLEHGNSNDDVKVDN